MQQRLPCHSRHSVWNVLPQQQLGRLLGGVRRAGGRHGLHTQSAVAAAQSHQQQLLLRLLGRRIWLWPCGCRGLLLLQLLLLCLLGCPCW